jgi:dolichyl-phosphate beta-glucosyltransferase
VEAVSLSVIVPAFEVAGLLKTELPRLAAKLAEAEDELGSVEMIFVDDGSHDETAEVIDAHLLHFPSARLVRLPWPCGPGTVVRAGVAVATGDAIVIADWDRCANVRHLLTLVRLLEDADLVVESTPAASTYRELTAVSSRLGSAAYRRLGSRLASHTLAAGVHQLTAFRSDVAKALFTLLQSPELALGVEATVVTSSMGLRIVQLPAADSPATGTPGCQPRGGRHASLTTMASDLLRARGHRSRVLKSGHRDGGGLGGPAKA